MHLDIEVNTELESVKITVDDSFLVSAHKGAGGRPQFSRGFDAITDEAEADAIRKICTILLSLA